MPAWLTWTLVALFSWGVWAVLSKILGDTFSPRQSQALSTLGMLPVLAFLALPRFGVLRTASRKGLGFALLGGIATAFGNVAYYDAVARGEKVATVVALTALYPLVTILLAFGVLRERLSRVQFAGLLLSLVAIWLFNVQSEGGLLSPTLLFALPPIALWGLAGFLQKLSTNHVSGEIAAIAYLGVSIPVAAVLVMTEPLPAAATTRAWVLVLALGFFLAFGNYAILAAFARGGKAAVISPLGSLYPVVSVPFAVLVLGERIGPREVVAIVASLASVAALSWETTPATPPAPQRIS